MAENAPELTAPETAPEGVESTPPWAGSDFDAEKAWGLIQNLRADKEKLAARRVITDEEQEQLTEYQRMVEANRSDAERQAEELSRWQTDAQRWRTEAVSARIEAIAVNDFTDPSDAISALDPAQYLDAGGQIDEAAIRTALADILEKKPHWRRTPDGPVVPRAPAPNPAQGAGGGQFAATGNPADQFAAILQAQLRAPR